MRMPFFESPGVPTRRLDRALGVATCSIGLMRMKCLDRLRSVIERLACECGGRHAREAGAGHRVAHVIASLPDVPALGRSSRVTPA